MQLTPQRESYWLTSLSFLYVDCLLCVFLCVCAFEVSTYNMVSVHLRLLPWLTCRRNFTECPEWFRARNDTASMGLFNMFVEEGVESLDSVCRFR